MAQELPEIVFVKNKNPDAWKAKWNGTPYTFPTKGEVQIPYEAAVHLFAYGLEDDKEVTLRLVSAGKSSKFIKGDDGRRELVNTMPEARKWLSNFKIKPGKYIPQEDEMAPAEIPKSSLDKK